MILSLDIKSHKYQSACSSKGIKMPQGGMRGYGAHSSLTSFTLRSYGSQRLKTPLFEKSYIRHSGFLYIFLSSLFLYFSATVRTKVLNLTLCQTKKSFLFFSQMLLHSHRAYRLLLMFLTGMVMFKILFFDCHIFNCARG